MVKHYDLERQDGWIDKNEIENVLTPMVSLGFVTAENDTFLTLSMSDTEDEVLFTFTLHKSLILEITEISTP